MEINSLKLLTNSQQIKAEKITELLLELKKSGVYPIIVGELHPPKGRVLLDSMTSLA